MTKPDTNTWTPGDWAAAESAVSKTRALEAIRKVQYDEALSSRLLRKPIPPDDIAAAKARLDAFCARIPNCRQWTKVEVHIPDGRLSWRMRAEWVFQNVAVNFREYQGTEAVDLDRLGPGCTDPGKAFWPIHSDEPLPEWLVIALTEQK